MNSDLKKNMNKKAEGHQMNPHEKIAKMAVLQHLKKTAEDAMKEHMAGGGVKKVSVMSNSPEGLEEGLDHAKGMVGKLNPEEEGSHGDHGDEGPDALEGDEPHELTRGDVSSPGHSTHENANFSEDHTKAPPDGDLEDKEAVPGDTEEKHEDDMSHEELDAKIQKLMHLKSAKQAKMRG